MAREKLENGSIHSNSLIGTLGIGSILCMFCIVILGLKLKWFRAQIKFGGSQIDKKRGQPIEAVGFKFRTNAEDYQSFKIISEFSSITESPQYPSTNSKFGINTSQHQRTNKLTKSDSSPNINATSNAYNTQKSPALTNKSKSSSNLTQNITEIKTNKSKSEIKHNIQSSSNDIGSIQNTASNSKEPQNRTKAPTRSKPSKSTKQKTKAPKLPEAIKLKETKPPEIQTDTFGKNLNINNNRTETDAISNITFENDDNAKSQVESPLQIRNPLVNTYKRPTKFEEENWDINLVEETPKQKLFIALETEDDDSYFSPNASSMYSSQAASIFFGGPPAVPPRSPSRKLTTYDSDNESVGSQTSA